MLKRSLSACVVAFLAITALHAANLRTADIKEEVTFVTRFMVPDDVKKPTDSARFLELSTIIYYVDSTYWDYIRGTSSMERFLKRISEHQQKHQDKWLTAFRGIEFARDSVHCLGHPWEPEADARWHQFIRFGPPSSYWSPMYEVRRSSGQLDTTQTYFYWWNTPDTGLAAQMSDIDTTNPFPVRVEAIISDTIRTKYGKALYPEMDVASFPNEDGTFDVALTAWNTGDRLTKETILETRALTAKLGIFSDSLVDSATFVQRLGLTGLVLSVTANKEDANLMGYFSSTLPRGRYTAKLAIEGHRNNSGTCKEKFVLPSIYPDGTCMSDVFLLDRYPVKGEDTPGGIERLGQHLFGRGSHDFHRGDTLTSYVEITIPEAAADSSSWASLSPGELSSYFPDSGWSYHFKVYLKLYDKGTKRHGEAKKPIVFADSLENPVLSWGGIDVKQALDEMMRAAYDEQADSRLKFITAQAFKADSRQTSFRSSFEILPQIAFGEYWVIIKADVYDVEGRKVCTCSSRTKVRVSPRVITSRPN